MGKFSISFVILALILGLFIGAVTGSLIHQVFGLTMLNTPMFGQSFTVAENFYILKRLEVELSPAAVIGFIITALILYKKGNA